MYIIEELMNILKIWSGYEYTDLIIDEDIYIEKETVYCMKERIKLDFSDEDKKFIKCLYYVIEKLKKNYVHSLNYHNNIMSIHFNKSKDK